MLWKPEGAKPAGRTESAALGDVIECPRSLLEELQARGWHWERLFVCIPPGLDLDPTPWAATAGPGAAARRPRD